MAPEAIAPTVMDDKDHEGGRMKLGKASDIWSLGCILYQMLFTRPPFAALSTVQKLTAIPNPNFPIIYPAHPDMEGVEVVQSCLIRDPKQRRQIGGTNGLLSMDYLHPYRSRSLPHSQPQSQSEGIEEKVSPTNTPRKTDVVY